MLNLVSIKEKKGKAQLTSSASYVGTLLYNNEASTPPNQFDTMERFARLYIPGLLSYEKYLLC